jgi:hypothetical protein
MRSGYGSFPSIRAIGCLTVVAIAIWTGIAIVSVLDPRLLFP